MPTLHITVLRRAFTIFGVTTLALSIWFSPTMHLGNLAAASGCPADGRHLMPVRGGRHFFSGVNVPWLNGGFGADFGTVEEWGQHTYNSAATERMFAALAARGANSVRWWLFADGRGAPEFDSPSGGAVTGFDSATLPAIADAARLAEQYNLQLVFTLWSFDMLQPDGTPSTKGEHAGGHHDLIVDAAKRRSFIDRALIPLLRYQVPGTSYTLGTHPAIYGWEVINEPEWAIREAGPSNAGIAQQVSLAEMQRFVAEVAGAIHRNSNQTVTVGAAAMKWNSSTAPGAQGNWWSDAALQRFDADGYLDYYQIHFYDWMNGDGKTWTYSPLKVSWAAGGFDKPVVIGEHPANAGGTGVGVRQMLDIFLTNCYAGAWGWSYFPVDDSGSWADLSGPLSDFNACYADLVAIPSRRRTEAADLPNRLYLPLTRGARAVGCAR